MGLLHFSHKIREHWQTIGVGEYRMLLKPPYIVSQHIYKGSLRKVLVSSGFEIKSSAQAQLTDQLAISLRNCSKRIGYCLYEQDQIDFTPQKIIPQGDKVVKQKVMRAYKEDPTKYVGRVLLEVCEPNSGREYGILHGSSHLRKAVLACDWVRPLVATLTSEVCQQPFYKLLANPDRQKNQFTKRYSQRALQFCLVLHYLLLRLLKDKTNFTLAKSEIKKVGSLQLCLKRVQLLVRLESMDGFRDQFKSLKDAERVGCKKVYVPFSKINHSINGHQLPKSEWIFTDGCLQPEASSLTMVAEEGFQPRNKILQSMRRVTCFRYVGNAMVGGTVPSEVGAATHLYSVKLDQQITWWHYFVDMERMCATVGSSWSGSESIARIGIKVGRTVAVGEDYWKQELQNEQSNLHFLNNFLLGALMPEEYICCYYLFRSLKETILREPKADSKSVLLPRAKQLTFFVHTSMAKEQLVSLSLDEYYLFPNFLEGNLILKGLSAAVVVVRVNYMCSCSAYKKRICRCLYTRPELFRFRHQLLKDKEGKQFQSKLLVLPYILFKLDKFMDQFTQKEEALRPLKPFIELNEADSQLLPYTRLLFLSLDFEDEALGLFYQKGQLFKSRNKAKTQKEFHRCYSKAPFYEKKAQMVAMANLLQKRLNGVLEKTFKDVYKQKMIVREGHYLFRKKEYLKAAETYRSVLELVQETDELTVQVVHQNIVKCYLWLQDYQALEVSVMGMKYFPTEVLCMLHDKNQQKFNLIVGKVVSKHPHLDLVGHRCDDWQTLLLLKHAMSRIEVLLEYQRLFADCDLKSLSQEERQFVKDHLTEQEWVCYTLAKCYNKFRFLVQTDRLQAILQAGNEAEYTLKQLDEEKQFVLDFLPYIGEHDQSVESEQLLRVIKSQK